MSRTNMKLDSACTSLLVILFCVVCQCTDTTTLEMGQSIGTSDSLVSANGSFELRFFPEENSTKYYVGIKFKNIPDDKFVWVANRDFPFPRLKANLTIDTDGNLKIVTGEAVFYITRISGSSITYAELLDTGNLILFNASNSAILWQSFDHPTDTLLPGMNLGQDEISSWSLTSWTSADNPAPGVFSLQAVQRQLIIQMEGEIYWIGDESSNFTFQSSIKRNQNNTESTVWSQSYFKRNQGNTESTVWSRSYLTWKGEYGSRLVLEVSGELNQQLWSDEAKRWISLQSSRCGTKGLCGNFGICNPDGQNSCDCLYGFRPYNESSWKHGNTSQGCVRNTEILCSNTSSVGFLELKMVDFPQNDMITLTRNDMITSTNNDPLSCQRACFINCSCLAYAYGLNRDCMVWYKEVLNLRNISRDVGSDNLRPSFFLKLDSSELHSRDSSTRNQTEPGNKEDSNRREVLKIVIPISCLALLVVGLLVFFYWRRKLSREGEDLLLFDVGISMKVGSSEIFEAENKVSKVNKREVKLPLFSLPSVSAATDNFSAENKLGEGGFGPVYKGKLLNGGEVAVKRLSRRSGQGWEELKNEALLIAKLQHNNLVRLLGCCIEREEKMLIYEFMPNKSLDFFLFDATKSKMLYWGTRVRIIDGIAQGLLYLHQYSRFRIIHRDLKASNILLDINMNPKISDFGVARIFSGNVLQANTNRIVGTYGYMSPEYALEGIFSIKSDVFSFGVLLLEIISGKKNTGLYHTDSLNVLGFAWDLWTTGRGVDLMDPMIKDASIKDIVVLRYVNIALLCVQESPEDRPTMSDIVYMIGNENADLPSPKPHAFLKVRGSKNVISAGSATEKFSLNAVTNSTMEAR